VRASFTAGQCCVGGYAARRRVAQQIVPKDGRRFSNTTPGEYALVRAAGVRHTLWRDCVAVYYLFIENRFGATAGLPGRVMRYGHDACAR